MAGSSVVGLGAGVILILILWTLTAVAWVQLSKNQSGLRSIVTFLSLLLTVSLFFMPTDEDAKKSTSFVNPDQIRPEDAFEIYDYGFIWKAFLIMLMLISIFGALGVYLNEFWTVKIRGSPSIPRKKFEDLN